MNEPTPGSWIALPPAFWEGPDGQWIVPEVAHCGNGERSEANARLIAAAPDYDAAAREIDAYSLVIESSVRRCAGADSKHYKDIVAALKANRAAIAKATGDTSAITSAEQKI